MKPHFRSDRAERHQDAAAVLLATLVLMLAILTTLRRAVNSRAAVVPPHETGSEHVDFRYVKSAEGGR